MTAGYSGTPLARKLGIQPDCRLVLLDAPEGFDATLAPLPQGVIIRRAARGAADVVVLFVDRQSRLEKRFPVARKCIDGPAAIWVAWPKKSSGMPTDLSFDVVQKIGLASGLVDNKVCAVDETWSGLRFVIRKRDR